MEYRVEICRENYPVIVYARADTLEAAVALMVPVTDRYRWLRIVNSEDRIIAEKFDMEPYFVPGRS